MTAPVRWHRSSYSTNGGNCLELGELPNAAPVRDSKDEHGSVVLFDHSTWNQFVAAVARGELGG
ncbi:DUF397 domain-containing protein [Streptomyces sp. MS19]|uniref:DUF397 domain-containing protein n=1 Tax=Streptomyces sp. MS19 TaxID=3385972 RepID=UPI00399F9436